ncbi:Site-specific recombinase XerD [Ralstonia sp. 25mfcol4.1]|uniref:tyrosine-type recombinase/integrase n=1 Tax=Ralstonia sp. 25mfcol4.1 TaxID=1761899 RepID=UPI000882BB8E|nr:site-specific integrase [Ralstonia sp. 25mfcol4.1]SDO61813.1 Site-specific recombinase XerD [Ralstonia sp. 25mfcol4.1]
MRPKINLRAAMAQVTDAADARMTFAELCAAFCAMSDDDSDERRLKKWVEAFGTSPAWELTTRHFSLAAEAMMQSGQYKASTVNRDLSSVGSVFKWAQRRHLSPIGFVSPTVGIPRYDEAIRRVEVSNKEIERLLAAAHGYKDRRFAVYVRLMIETGARRGEVRERQWKDVDLETRTITVIQTKTDRPRTLFFSEETAALIRRVWPAKREPDALVFQGRRYGQPINFRKAWEDVAAAIGRPDLHLHDLRHHRAAELLRKGTTLAVAAQVLGHSSLILQRRYGHLEDAVLRRAAESSWQAPGADNTLR